jgi:integrase
MSKRRRGAGEGTIVQRRDGRWMGQIDLGYIDGKRKHKTIYGKMRKEVAEQLNILLAQHGQGYNIAPERQTIAQFLER